MKINSNTDFLLLWCVWCSVACAHAWQCMLEIYNTMKYFSVRVTAYTCSLLIKACHRYNDAHTALRLTHDFQALNVALDQPSLQLLNELLRTNPGTF